MSRNICVYLEFLTDAHRRAIEQAAEQTGFSVRFFSPEELEEAKAYVADCEVLYAHSPSCCELRGRS